MIQKNAQIDSNDALMGRVAVYIAGDHNIFFPAIVTIASIKQHNAHHPFDFFISFKGEHLTGRMKQILDEHEIDFIDVSEFDQYGSVSGLALMRENRWPEEIFYNWIAPAHFHKMGYEYALKVDYDILCLGPYELSRLLNPDCTFTALTWDVNLRKDGFTNEHADALNLPEMNPDSVPYFNAGFVSINLHRYVSGDLYEIFKSTYSTIQSVGNEVNMLEQIALAVTAFRDPGTVSRLDESYNTRITTLPRMHAGLPNIRNIHYITQNKPWRPVDFRYLNGYTKAHKTCLYMYRDAWTNFAAKIDGYAEFVDVKPPTALETIGMYTEIFSSHYRMERELLAGTSTKL